MAQRWAPALFSRFCAFALASAKPKKSAKARRKKSAKKSESAEQIRAFSSPHSENIYGFRAQSRFGRGKTMVLSKLIQ